MAHVDLVRFGRGIRALRMRRRWRQMDLATEASVSQSTIARIELGRSGRIAVETLEKVALAVGARVDLRLNFNGEALDRLLDQDHAALVEIVVGRLRLADWEVRAEVSFSIRGERGSIDIAAWHAATRVLLVIEIKSVVPDVQAMLFTFDRKARLGREIAASVGWQPVAVGRLLVIGTSRTARRRVDTHQATFEAAVPDRFVAIRRFIAAPDPLRPIRGLLFVPASPRATTRHRQPASPRPARVQSPGGRARLAPPSRRVTLRRDRRDE
jgi:transcriptional regulator with XRE-family HTH domain